MKTKHTPGHTPGPWVFFIDGFGDHSIESAQDSNGNRLPVAMTFRRNNADARLIAAAPDLLAALRALVHPMASDEDLDAARAAIAKAEGNT